MKILITGTAGFIGFHLANALAEEGHDIVGLDNINDYYDVNLKYARLAEAGIFEKQICYNKAVTSQKYNNYKFIKLNLEDNENIQELFKNEQFEVVCNLAAQAGVRYSIENPYAYVQSNIVGFLSILEACRYYGVKHLLYASSSSVYGDTDKIPFCEDDIVNQPVSLYAATKLSNELMASAYTHLFGFKTIGLRFFTVYGPWGRPDMAPMLFLNAIKNNQPIKLFNSGKLTRDFTYVEDIIRGISDLIKSRDKLKWNIFNIGASQPINLIDFIDTLEHLMNKKIIKMEMPFQPGDVKSTFANTARIYQETGYKPSIKLTEGLAKFIIWHNEYYSN